MTAYTPQQEIFTAIRRKLLDLYEGTYEVYDSKMPPEDVPYPFFFVGNTTESAADELKDAEFAEVSLTVDIWHNDLSQRGTVSGLCGISQFLLGTITDTPHYSVHKINQSYSIITDKSTSTPLLHAICEYRAKVTKKRA